MDGSGDHRKIVLFASPARIIFFIDFPAWRYGNNPGKIHKKPLSSSNVLLFLWGRGFRAIFKKPKNLSAHLPASIFETLCDANRTIFRWPPDPAIKTFTPHWTFEKNHKIVTIQFSSISSNSTTRVLLINQTTISQKNGLSSNRFGHQKIVLFTSRACIIFFTDFFGAEMLKKIKFVLLNVLIFFLCTLSCKKLNQPTT